MKFAIYTRVSTDKQEAENQLPALREWALLHQHTIVAEYTDTASGIRLREQLDDLFIKQAAMSDEKERKKLVLEIQQRILELAIYPIIFWDVYNIGFWKEVRGYMPGFGPYTHNNLDHVWLAR